MSKKTVAIDLDGVIAKYDGFVSKEHFGEPIKGVDDFLTRLRSKYKVVIFSSRTNGQVNRQSPEELKQLVVNYLDKWNLAYDDVYVGQGKPLAIAYIDDRAVSCRPQYDKEAYAKALFGVAMLDDGEYDAFFEEIN